MGSRPQGSGGSAGPGAIAASVRRAPGNRRRTALAALALVVGGIPPLPYTGAVQARGVQPTAILRGAEPEGGCRRTLIGVAHQDDDLLFINPEIQRLVRARCFAGTVYLTAGDAGLSFTADSYVRRREQGLRAAYARMAGVPDRWMRVDLPVRGRTLVSYVLAGRPDVRLVFLRLPDGFPKGTGSPRHAQQSLLKLFRGLIPAMGPVDGSASFTGEELVSVLAGVIAERKAERVLTLDFDSATFGVGPPNPADHSDHEMAGRYFRRAAFRTTPRLDATPYVGYGLPLLPGNLTPEQRRDKLAVYDVYAGYAGCTAGPCPPRVTLSQTFRQWTEREHRRLHRGPRPGEILSAISRTGARAVVERCLARSGRRAAAGSVMTADCDDGPAQQWVFLDGAVRSAPTGACLTAGATVTVSPCDGSGRQIWWSDADGRIGSGTLCLHQDDLAALGPRLGMRACSPYRPEVRWRW
ncbi:PIG-L family deacetylase [Streptomyces sp. NBC_01264]|uniref:PIG-L family deacetylase n=1 Tax=Streptomyces sp. NBC_01264 TaxID=2903804 RepID=UPI00225BE5F2|nr:ricin-type beta-trefoil lectin domain protein [Streptomyces sp. NBC_01264]MCX4781714.1 PIG-L family deacetylase [Streptomyces sp. NBC_01264]